MNIYTLYSSGVWVERRRVGRQMSCERRHVERCRVVCG